MDAPLRARLDAIVGLLALIAAVQLGGAAANTDPGQPFELLTVVAVPSLFLVGCLLLVVAAVTALSSDS